MDLPTYSAQLEYRAGKKIQVSLTGNYFIKDRWETFR